VTGHRDPRGEDIEALKRRVGQVFDGLARDYLTADGATPIVVLSSLAEGADQLVASVALERGAILIAPLPMPLEEYRKDFQFGLTPNALSEFDRLLARAAAAPEIPSSMAPPSKRFATTRGAAPCSIAKPASTLFAIAKYCWRCGTATRATSKPAGRPKSCGDSARGRPLRTRRRSALASTGRRAGRL